MARAIGSGAISFGMVTISVKLSCDLVHAPCGTRIKHLDKPLWPGG